MSLSSNFSQTLGTAKKRVGLAHVKVSTSVPYNASGLANHVLAPKRIGDNASHIKPAI